MAVSGEKWMREMEAYRVTSSFLVTPWDSYYGKRHRLGSDMKSSDWEVLGLRHLTAHLGCCLKTDLDS